MEVGGMLVALGVGMVRVAEKLLAVAQRGRRRVRAVAEG